MGAKMIGSVAVLTPVNILSNGGVEQGAESPDDWYTSANTAWSTAQARRGTHSLQIAVTNQTADWRAKVFPVVGGAAYRVSGWFKGAGSSECFLTIRFWSDAEGTAFLGESNIVLDAEYASWTQKVGTFIAPGLAVSADVLFRCPSNTTAAIFGDDFAVNAA